MLILVCRVPEAGGQRDDVLEQTNLVRVRLGWNRSGCRGGDLPVS